MKRPECDENHFLAFTYNVLTFPIKAGLEYVHCSIPGDHKTNKIKNVSANRVAKPDLHPSKIRTDSQLVAVANFAVSVSMSHDLLTPQAK